MHACLLVRECAHVVTPLSPRWLVSAVLCMFQVASTSPDVARIQELEDCNKQLAAEAAHAKGVDIFLILPPFSLISFINLSSSSLPPLSQSKSVSWRRS